MTSKPTTPWDSYSLPLEARISSSAAVAPQLTGIGAPAMIAPEIGHQFLDHRRIRFEHHNLGMTDPIKEDGVVANVGSDIQDSRTR